MEKIQSAIAKARAIRAAEQRPVEPVAVTPPLTESAAPISAPVPPPKPKPEPEPRRAPAEGVIADSVARAWADMPTLKIRPRLLERYRITSYESGPGAAEIDKLRTRLLQQMRANGWRRVAITSPGPNCGKSVLAMNLGFSLARQSDQRTLVAEIDLRRPSIARALGISGRETFARVLEGVARVEDCAVRAGPHLAFLTNTGPTRHSAELLQSARTRDVLETIDARYAPTVFLFDLPPMTAGDDAIAFADRVDCVLIVAGAGTTTAAEIDVCERDLASQTNVLGVVLNKCRYMPAESGYGSYN